MIRSRTVQESSRTRRPAALTAGLILAGLVLAVLAASCGRSGTAPSSPAASKAESGAGEKAGAGSKTGARAIGPVAIMGPDQVIVRFVDLQGLRAELAARQKAGKPVFLNFWATWCAPCMQEMPDLANLAREWGAGGPEMVGVSLDGWVIADESEAESAVRTLLA